MSFYISYSNTNENSRSGALTAILKAAASKAGVDLMEAIEEHGWVDAVRNDAEEIVGKRSKSAFKLAFALAEEDKAALQSLGAEIGDAPPKGYEGCKYTPR